MQSFAGQGVFWVDGNEDDQVTGSLTYDPTDGVELELIGTFGDFMDQFNSEDESNDCARIHGVANGRLVTLVDASRTGVKMQMPGIPSANYRASYLLIGDNIDGPRPLLFPSVIVKVSNLTQWVGRSGIEVNVAWPEGGRPLRWSHAFTPPQPESAFLPEVGEVEIGVHFAIGGDNTTESHIRQSAFVKMQPPAPLDIANALTVAARVRDLVALATHGPVAIEAVSLTPDDAQDGDGTTGKRTVELRAHIGSTSETASRSHREMLFTYAQLGGAEGLARWLRLAGELAPAIGTLMTLRSGDFLYAENRLQNVIHAAESIHRIKFANMVVPHAEHIERVARILAAHQGDDCVWLARQLAHSNEPTLRHRLLELVDFAGAPATTFVSDKHKWATAVTNGRNRLTRFQGEGPSADTLFYLSESVYVVLLLCILRMLETEDDLVASVTDNRRIAWLRDRLPAAVQSAMPRA